MAGAGRREKKRPKRRKQNGTDKGVETRAAKLTPCVSFLASFHSRAGGTARHGVHRQRQSCKSHKGPSRRTARGTARTMEVLFHVRIVCNDRGHCSVLSSETTKMNQKCQVRLNSSIYFRNFLQFCIKSSHAQNFSRFELKLYLDTQCAGLPTCDSCDVYQRLETFFFPCSPV